MKLTVMLRASYKINPLTAEPVVVLASVHVNYNQCIDLHMENKTLDTLYNHENHFPIRQIL